MAIRQAADLVRDGDLLAIGGNTLNRAPMAMLRGIVEAGRRGLGAVKTAGAMDIDLLCLADSVRSVDAGFVSYETQWGLANFYRKAVQEGRVRANEHACYTVICALRAASCGAPFLPVRGLVDSQLIETCGYFARVPDPFTGEEVTVVRAIRPDVAVVHVSACDEEGNAVIEGPYYDDIVMTRAARRVILTTERLHRGRGRAFPARQACIPGFLVDAVVPVSGGAWPCACYGAYRQDDEEIGRFRSLDAQGLPAYLAECGKRVGYRTGGRLRADA